MDAHEHAAVPMPAVGPADTAPLSRLLAAEFAGCQPCTAAATDEVVTAHPGLVGVALAMATAGRDELDDHDGRARTYGRAVPLDDVAGRQAEYERIRPTLAALHPATAEALVMRWTALCHGRSAPALRFMRVYAELDLPAEHRAPVLADALHMLTATFAGYQVRGVWPSDRAAP